MADPPPQQNPTFIIKKMIDVAQTSTTAGNSASQKKPPQAREDDFESLPDPLYGTTDHVEPGIWASWVMETIFTKSGREFEIFKFLRSKKPIRELVFRDLLKGKYFLSRLHAKQYSTKRNNTENCWNQAALLQIVGRLAEKACNSCIGGFGPFTTCVVVDDVFGGSCANCQCNGVKGARRCTHSSKNALNESAKGPKRGHGSNKKQDGAANGQWRYIARSRAPKYPRKKPRHSIRALMAQTARQTRSVENSVKRLNLELGKILSANQSETMKAQRVKIESNMQGLNVQFDTLQGAMEELATMVMECDDDVTMQSGDKIDNAIMISDDEDVAAGVSKMETAESQGIKTESSKCEEDDEPKTKKEKQNVNEDACEHNEENEGIIDIKEEK
ncbi:Protein of unknown function DUF3716 [Penicillium cataractarum]|uniref:Uncharacterized protein n=1 Tax=Penicillium cataractarum TaxID=2100454 RepID=A0A9W9SLU4_9EURO|nr:Protein of unknown function DUF3716 [Penicillium cataractarum]KAJ5380310.1 Protein of unknown function DUF3716 [Penicillium cataractarum]